MRSPRDVFLKNSLKLKNKTEIFLRTLKNDRERLFRKIAETFRLGKDPDRKQMEQGSQ